MAYRGRKKTFVDAKVQGALVRRLVLHWVSFISVAALVAFSAIYLQHHYILDVVAGVAYALVASTVVEYALGRREAPTVVPVPLMPGGDSRA